MRRWQFSEQRRRRRANIGGAPPKDKSQPHCSLVSLLWRSAYVVLVAFGREGRLMIAKPRLHHCLIFVAGWIRRNTSYFFSHKKLKKNIFFLHCNWLIVSRERENHSLLKCVYFQESIDMCCLFVAGATFGIVAVGRLGIFGVAISD